MITINTEYEKIIRENLKENQIAGKEIMSMIRRSPLYYHDKLVYTLQIPKIFTRSEIDHFQKIVNTTYRIFEKVIEHYLADPDYRALFPFSKELEDLILTPSLYPCPLPIARFDIFYDEESTDFKFCEINTDGTSAMLEDQILSDLLSENPAHQIIRQKYELRSFELFDSWVNTFMEIYASYQKKIEKPNVAIVDFLENAAITEFEEFERRFRKAGISCKICEITELIYENGHLYDSSGYRIDLIYRRAVTSDIMNRIDQIRPFIHAVKENAVCLIGSFRTQIIHNKWLFHVLHRSETSAFLDPSEQEFIRTHIPGTNLLTSKSAAFPELRKDKDRWILKPLDSYGSQGVFAGCDDSQQKWEQHLDELRGRDYIYQEYYPPYRTINISFAEENPDFKEYTNMSGLYVYNGKFSGVYSRLSDGGIISSLYNERSVPTLVLE